MLQMRQLVQQRLTCPWHCQRHRPVVSVSASSKSDASVSSSYVGTITTTVTAVIFASSVINQGAPPSAKFACAATALATLVAGSLLAPAPTGGSETSLQQPHPTSPTSTAVGSSSSNGSSSSSNGGSGSSNGAGGSTSSPPGSQLEALHSSQARLPLAAAAGAVVLSAVVPVDALPSVSSLCLVVLVGTIVYRHQQEQATTTMDAAPMQQQEQQKCKEQEQEQQKQTELQQQLEQQLQQQRNQVRNLQAQLKAQRLQLERELRHERKGAAQLDKLKEQLKAEQAARQELEAQLAVAEYQLMNAREQLDGAAEQAAPSKAASTSSGPAFNRRLAPQTGSGALKQAAEQGLGTAAAPAAPAGSGPVVAFVGGKSMKESDRKLLPVDAKEVRFYGSPRDAGSGQLKSLEQALKAGSIDEVYMLTRWNGHGTTKHVRRLCKERGIPCHLLDAGEKVLRKAEWAELVTSSDDDAA